MRRVVVTGMGLVTPLGGDVETTWRNLLAGKSGIGPITRFDTSDHKAKIAGEVKPKDHEYGFDPDKRVDSKVQRQVEAPAFLGLPDMGHLVNEEGLAVQRLLREIVGPAAAFGVEIDIAHRRHRASARLERPPFAANQLHPRIIDGIAEHRSR